MALCEPVIMREGVATALTELDIRQDWTLYSRETEADQEKKEAEEKEEEEASLFSAILDPLVETPILSGHGL